MTCPTRHNILWIVFDSLSETACAGLPTLSAFRDSSLHFARAYAPSPEAGPARASLFTGLDMAAHGVWTEGVALPGRETTVAQRMADGGMRTWLVGRRQLAGASHWTTEHARPFEYAQFDWAHGPLHRSRQNAYLAWLEARAPEAYQEIFPAQPDPDATEISDRQRHALAALPEALGFNSWVGARVCAQLSQPAGGANFFGVAGLVVGETQGGAPNPHIPCETVDAGAMRQADAALAAMLERLDSTGLAERTAVVVTAARGALATSRGPMQDSALHVPLMIRMPGRAPRRTEAMVSTIDVAPTLYALADMPPPRRIQGRSLLDGTPRDWALSRLCSPDHRWQTALCMDRWKLVVTHGANGRAAHDSLFDLTEDPGEASNLAADPAHQDRLEQMVDRMIDARVALEDRTEPRIAKF